MVIEIPEKEFKQSIIESRRSAVVMFYMSQCPYCRKFMPEFHEFSNKIQAMSAQVDISDYNSDLWDIYQIEAVPTVIAFRDGLICTRIDAVYHVGLSPGALEKEMQNKPECFKA